MATMEVGPARRQWGTNNPKAIALLDLIHDRMWANVKPFVSLSEWSLLGIAENASKREVKNAYRRQSRKLHPDKGGDPEAFKTMYAAYRKLLKVAKD